MAMTKNEMTTMINTLLHVLKEKPVDAGDFTSNELEEKLMELTKQVKDSTWITDPAEEFFKHLEDDMEEAQIKWLRKNLKVVPMGNKWKIYFPKAVYHGPKTQRACRVALDLVKTIFMGKNHWVDWKRGQPPVINMQPMKPRK